VIRAWRIDKAKRSKAESFSGDGARKVAGRWNSKVRAVVYAASSLSLAALEKFVHLGEDGAGIEFVSYEIGVPADVKIIQRKLTEMPADWRTQPAPLSTQRMGDAWIGGLHSAVLIVPSVVTPSEFNFLLNPAHPEFARIEISAPKAYSFDPRMWK
jgi:RES domain-containing protein